MPVVELTFDRLSKYLPRAKVDKVLEMLPYAALDIEGVEDRRIRVEYNPNRPDFSSDLGILRALKGILEVEIGMPRFAIARSRGVSVIVDREVEKIRPYVSALVAMNGRLDDDAIKQLISMQEDLNNGIGRRRKKASIGLHNLDPIQFPAKYTAAGEDYSFVPLAGSSQMTIKQILRDSEAGKQYGHIIEKFGKYPLIVDKAGSVLSLPPIINGNTTRIDTKTRNLFVEVTATDRKAAEDILAVIAVTLQDARFRIGTVSVRSGGGKIATPRMTPTNVVADLNYVNSVLGLELDSGQIIRCLRKSRLDAIAKGGKIICKVPRYRTDISQPIDIVEEVAIGYGVYNLVPRIPSSSSSGQRNDLSRYFSAIRETLAGLGMLESLNFSLTSSQVQYDSFGRNSGIALTVDGSKSVEHEVLRDSLIPSLLHALSRNVHEEYPQRLFEIGKVFYKNREASERWSAAAVIAHAEAGYSEIKSVVQAMLRLCFRKEPSTRAAQNPFFIAGRSAEILVDNKVIGSVGEIVPLALATLKLRVPVAAFELNLGEFLIKD
ncbi:MAG: phenylalanine--tRNA ligase subunit beta [Nitrososphaera sp.]